MLNYALICHSNVVEELSFSRGQSRKGKAGLGREKSQSKQSLSIVEPRQSKKGEISQFIGERILQKTIISLLTSKNKILFLLGNFGACASNLFAQKKSTTAETPT